MVKLDNDDVNNLLDIVQENAPFLKEHKYFLLTEDMFEDYDELKSLVGYKVKYGYEGEHKNDGQLVDYFFDFKSPNGDKTTISTEMCLMVGWNHCYEETIK